MVIVIEKSGTVDNLEEVLSVEGVDMIQWGPSDYPMNTGRSGQGGSPEIRAVEHKVFETALKMGVPPRAEIGRADAARYYLDMGVRHFCSGTDDSILYSWWRQHGEELQKALAG